MLTAEGFKVTTVSNGGAALEQLAIAPIDLVLLDVMMPNLTGFAVCEKISAAERSHLLLNLSVLAGDQTSGHCRGLMYVQPTTGFDQRLQNASIRRRSLRRWSGADTVMRPSRLRVRQKVAPLAARVGLIGRICVIT
jgi:CheY-like chemotaxis protein